MYHTLGYSTIPLATPPTPWPQHRLGPIDVAVADIRVSGLRVSGSARAIFLADAVEGEGGQ